MSNVLNPDVLITSGKETYRVPFHVWELMKQLARYREKHGFLVKTKASPTACDCTECVRTPILIERAMEHYKP